MALNRKYANLPDLDLAPDVYETPDLVDEVSTLPTTTVRTNLDSDNETPSDPDIDHHAINAEEARSRFLRSSLDAHDIDFSDAVAAKRKAYRSKARLRRRPRGDDTDTLADLSDNEEEAFNQKLARLRRETEDLKVELARRKESGVTSQEEGDDNDGLLELSRALDGIHISAHGTSVDVALSEKLADNSQIPTQRTNKTSASRRLDMPATESSPASGLLAHAASFDARLTLIEAAMGVSTASNPFTSGDNGGPALQPVLPALDHLTSRLSALTGTLFGPSPASSTVIAASVPASAAAVTTPQIEALAARIKKLIVDADALTNAHKRAVDAAKAAQATKMAAAAAAAADDLSNLSVSSSSAATEVDPVATQRDEQAAKIQALYASLPTIQSLHPILPSVLERLRSLHAIHAGAAHASETLDALEKRQTEMRKEIDQWRDGLGAVEEKVRDGEAAMKKNIDVVGPWVKALEARVARLLD